MITLGIAKGFFNLIDGHEVVEIKFPSQMPIGIKFREDPWQKLPSVSDLYDLCKRAGLTGEQTIVKLLSVYHKYRHFRVAHLSRLPLVICFVGSRGSGKSVGAVHTAIIDYLLCGYRVWSNLDIVVRVVYRDAEKIFRSEDLDKTNLLDLEGSYSHGLIIIDEMNIALSESRRSMSNMNLNLNYAFQQIRKRDLSLIMTLQNEMWLDARIRWQMDIGVKCEDAFFTHSYGAQCVGDKSKWNVYDTSGVTGVERDESFIINRCGVWNRPFWKAYNTFAIQTHDDIKSFDVMRKASMIDARENRANEIAKQILSLRLERINTDEIWQRLEITDRNIQIAVGARLAELGAIRRRGTDNRYFYDFSGCIENSA